MGAAWEAGMDREPITVRAAFDADASVWFIESSSLAGLHAEGDTFDALAAKLPGLIEDLTEEASPPVEVIGHRRVIAAA